MLSSLNEYYRYFWTECKNDFSPCGKPTTVPVLLLYEEGYGRGQFKPSFIDLVTLILF